MRIEPKTAAVYAAGAFFFLLIFGVGWPGPGTWLLVFSLMLIAAAAAAWWLDGAIVPQQRAGAVLAGGGGGSPFTPRRAGRGAGRPGDSLLLSLGFPGPDRRGQWVLPDRVHLTALAGAIGLLAMIIFVGGTINGGGGAAATETPIEEVAPAIDFAAGGQASADASTGEVAAPGGAAVADSGSANGAANGATGAPLTQNSADVAPTAETATSPIVVATPSAAEPAPARPLEAPTTLPTADESVIHEVVSGDTIYDLAITYESSIEAILIANGLGENSTINVGDRLIIPAVEESVGVE